MHFLEVVQFWWERVGIKAPSAQVPPLNVVCNGIEIIMSVHWYLICTYVDFSGTTLKQPVLENLEEGNSKHTIWFCHWIGKLNICFHHFLYWKLSPKVTCAETVLKKSKCFFFLTFSVLFLVPYKFSTHIILKKVSQYFIKSLWQSGQSGHPEINDKIKVEKMFSLDLEFDDFLLTTAI